MDEMKTADNARKYLSFLIGSEKYGVDIVNVKEIIEYGHVTRVPIAPSAIPGVLNLSGNVVPIEDEEVSKQLERSFKKAGMKVLTGAMVESVDTSGDLCKVTVKTKKGEEVIEAEVVLSAVGVATNLEGIGLEETGIVVEKGKVVVDDFYRTNVEGYYEGIKLHCYVLS
mgnify:CR=1 FL=1